MDMDMEKGRVCVTGAGGYIASWVVKLLLSQGYVVHGTVREISDEKCAHLKKLDKASENLKLFKAELLDYDSLRLAIAGCAGVLHIASPVPSTNVPNPEAQVLEPAIKGTLNVLKACVEANIKRVVFVSSFAAIGMNPSWPKDQIMDETCWSDKEHCRENERWYCLSKTVAETEAWEYAKRTGLDLVSLCPTMVFGPVLQPTSNASTLILINLLKEGYESLENKVRRIVDVRDVAAAVVMAYEKPEAEGRYICTSHWIYFKDLVDKLRSIYPDYNYPKNYTETNNKEMASSEKLRKLGWTSRSLEETLVDSIESYRKSGILDYE